MSKQHKEQQQVAASESHSESPTVIGSPDQKMILGPYKACPAPTYHSLNRTWATQSNTADVGRSKQQFDTKVAPATQRWMEEWIQEQPWNVIGSFATVSSLKEHNKGKGETGSNSAVAGTEEQE